MRYALNLSGEMKLYLQQGTIQQQHSFDMTLCFLRKWRVWGKSLLSTHMLVGSSNSNAVYMCVKVLFGAHDIKER